MKKRIASVVALLLVVCMVLPMASCGSKVKVEEFVGEYTYNDSVVTMSSNWNPHTYQTTDESYPVDFLTSGLYSFIYNDELNPVEGKDPYKGYVIRPEMAAEMPVDVTEKIKAEHPEFNIPESATSGYAYVIKLNKDATWQNGEKINADTYVYSMKALLDPKMDNYRATDYFDGSFCIANAKNYYHQGTIAYTESMLQNKFKLADLKKGADGVYTALESEGIADGSIKIAAVDISSMTGQYFQNGVQVWTCGGQYATAMVAWAILYNYLMDGTRIIPDPSQPLIRQYIEITSYEEYEQYVKYVEGSLPTYDADEIADMIHYLNPDVTYADYETEAHTYSLADIIARHAYYYDPQG